VLCPCALAAASSTAKQSRAGDDGIAVFERIRYRRHDASVFILAFDLIELNGDDLRREPLERRKAMLARVLGRARARRASSMSTWRQTDQSCSSRRARKSDC
jgi:ATP-dependent DNA ligase